MSFITVLESLVATTLILAVVGIGYLAFSIKHPRSEKTKESVESTLLGCLAEACTWFAITVAAMVLYASQNFRLATVLIEVVGANMFSVTLIALSFVIVPMTFSMHKASGKKYKYHLYAIVAFMTAALFLGLYYWVTYKQ